MFADDISVIMISRNFEDFCSLSNPVLPHIIERFAANNLVLNLDKMTIIKFITKTSSHSTLRISYKDGYIEETLNTKFFGLQIDKHLNCMHHIKQMVPKLSAACYAIKSTVHISNINTFQSVYCAHFHSVVKCGIIFWGNSSNSGRIFTL
jgi:hypothetical protein